jgi:5-methyltetrahydropteroyltriglutamate--homocysteine methyltransferase
MLDGVEVVGAEQGIQFQGVQTKALALHISDRIGFPSSHPMLEHFRYLKAHTKVTPKMTIPSPSVMHFRLAPSAVDADVYADRDAILDDLATTYQGAIKAFYNAGCRYLQFDDTVWAYLCSEEQLRQAAARGLDAGNLAQQYARVINQALKAKPADMAITTHVCRGNFRSTWISEGGYEPVAEVLLAQLDYDGYFLEYDTDRAGGFEPLRFLPKGGKQVVVGLVTSKSGTLEKKDDIKRRLDEASKFAPLEQLCLSPQCGFASTEEGNVLTEQQQWAKLAMIVEVAREVWK